MTLPILQLDAKRAYPPRISKVTQPFWEGLAAGRFLTTECCQCNKLTFPPKGFCPHCWSSEVRWVDAPSTGTVYSHTTVHIAPATFAHEAPYRLCIVDLDGRLRVATRLVEADVAPTPGDAVELVVLQYEDGPLFAARPLVGKEAA